MNEALPRNTHGFVTDGLPLCPWCWAIGVRSSMDDVTVRLEDLVLAHGDGDLESPKVELSGEAREGALIVECPECHRPSALRLDRHDVALLPVRTAKDLRYLMESIR